SNQEFTRVFRPQERHVTVETLSDEVRLLSGKLEQEIKDANTDENYETAGELSKLKKTVTELDERMTAMSLDDSTDDRFKLEDHKRKLAQDIDTLTKDKKIARLRKEYAEAKATCSAVIDE